MSFFSFSLAALYGEIDSVSFLFFGVVALYDRILKVALALSLYPARTKMSTIQRYSSGSLLGQENWSSSSVLW